MRLRFMLGILVVCGGAAGAAPQWPALAVAPPGTAGAVVILTIKPLSLGSTQSVYGHGQNLGKWTVSFCSESATRLDVPRDRLMMAAPQLHDIPNQLAEDLIGRGAAADPRSLIGNNGDGALVVIGAAVTAAGVAKGSRRLTYIGVGIDGLRFLLQITKKRAPAPQTYFSDLLPDLVTLAPYGCSGDSGHHYFIVASLVHGAVTVDRVPVRIPEARP